ncbi:alkane 1-monooxygenase [Mycolicibacter arupensis]|jgi:alkane 1-monooxygenase|uniref:Alkane 1-monooxygenase n=1 Tax=Mycolicibacter arupensis TaxID=342002 RepID=A0A0F5MX38_9MYCO|nr:alkane 1-monooxygenase [Mycolicibacter arupensis]KAA1432742.1 alkane 1-monooxygenase [Mycolicibacter arupensis]KKB98622.1 alkane 1-monooxygenase [Mycolicibacter arupensis]MCV7275106.1 alkane 1-monooxygenase [Mycolicibacter arupensis]OQZ97810.1 alkane 1-monooxygenase [Mycolicibacter arupensis]TXI60015.1 MAG: alkane 1-monooxygenase [Mycolicibacter arupensis]
MSTEMASEPRVWQDKKRHLWLLGLVVPTMLFLMLPLVWALNLAGLHTAAQVPLYIGPILLYVLLPALDLWIGADGQNPPDEVMAALENDKYYRYATYAYIPFQYATAIFGAYLFTASDLGWLGFDGSLGWLGKIGVALTVATVAGVGINTAHELGHKRESLERWLAKITLAQVCYGHFYVEHNRGHHVRVATPEDPASARFGETFWEFLPRSVVGGIRSAWELEAQRIRRTGKSPWNPRTWADNDVLNALAMSVLFWGVLIAVFGVALVPYVLINAIYGSSLLESVNYLEHYGLVRQKQASGRYERCTPQHSWNSDHMVTNLFLYHLQRHSDHHANPTRRYQTLRSFDDSPNLPAGYGALIGVTYFPPVWRKLMDHRVLEHYNGDITRANLSPRRREKILARYQVPA